MNLDKNPCGVRHHYNTKLESSLFILTLLWYTLENENIPQNRKYILNFLTYCINKLLIKCLNEPFNTISVSEHQVDCIKTQSNSCACSRIFHERWPWPTCRLGVYKNLDLHRDQIKVLEILDRMISVYNSQTSSFKWQ
jgi:hypothetical protein